jgi:hypothetical protein
MGCIFTLGLAFAPAAVIGAYYRSWEAGVVSAVASSGGALIAFFLFRGAETLLGSASTATDGAGSSALPGLSVGWFVGLALSVWVSRARGVASDEPLPWHVVAQDVEILAARSGNSAGSSRDPFDCTRYTYAELCEAAEHINRTKYPESARRLVDEIARRVGQRP